MTIILTLTIIVIALVATIAKKHGFQMEAMSCGAILGFTASQLQLVGCISLPICSVLLVVSAILLAVSICE